MIGESSVTFDDLTEKLQMTPGWAELRQVAELCRISGCARLVWPEGCHFADGSYGVQIVHLALLAWLPVQQKSIAFQHLLETEQLAAGAHLDQQASQRAKC